jgi:Icc-related predicted phosphoesterase
MKVKVASDLHLEFLNSFEEIPDLGTADILVLAGDIFPAKYLKTNGKLKDIYLRFVDKCSKDFSHILYVLGNHCYYGYNYEGSKRKIKEHLPHNFQILDNDTVAINNWNFLGFTLWTDFRNENALEMMEAAQVMNDYKVIRITPKYRKLNPTDTLNFHKDSKKYLLNQLQTLNDNVFVISHHAPSYQSVPQQFKKHANGAYCSNLDDLIVNHPQIKYWVHGHTHNAFNYMIEGCRVICNPGGYPGQDTNFQKDFLIDI